MEEYSENLEETSGRQKLPLSMKSITSLQGVQLVVYFLVQLFWPLPSGMAAACIQKNDRAHSRIEPINFL